MPAWTICISSNKKYIASSFWLIVADVYVSQYKHHSTMFLWLDSNQKCVAWGVIVREDYIGELHFKGILAWIVVFLDICNLDETVLSHHAILNSAMCYNKNV